MRWLYRGNRTGRNDRFWSTIHGLQAANGLKTLLRNDLTASLRLTEAAMPRTLKLSGLLSAIILIATFARGATITGVVKGPDGAPFKGAFVQAQNTKTKITINVLSHKDGVYRVQDLPAGEYVLRIRALGYQADPRTGVTFTASQSWTKWPIEHDDGKSDRISVPACGDYIAGIFSRCARTHVVRDVFQQ